MSPSIFRIRCAALAVCGLGMLGSDPLPASPGQDYVLNCKGCHGAGAEGVPGKVPPLAHALGRFLGSPAGRNYVLRVPGAANSALSDAQLAAVLNWLLVEFNGGETPHGALAFTTPEVTRWRRTPLNSVMATRNSVVTSLAAHGSAPPAQY